DGAGVDEGDDDAAAVGRGDDGLGARARVEAGVDALGGREGAAGQPGDEDVLDPAVAPDVGDGAAAVAGDVEIANREEVGARTVYDLPGEDARLGVRRGGREG